MSSAVLARAPSAWDGLAESAALKIGTAARQLARTAGDVGGAGRIGALSAMRSDAEELVRRADALARMAQEPLPEDIEARTPSRGALPATGPAPAPPTEAPR